jgi:hypothetical protein
MADDLVDRIVKEKQEMDAALNLERRLQLDRARTIDDNSDYLWLELIKEAKATVDKFKRQIPGTEIGIEERTGSPPSGFDVVRPVFPISKLSVWRNSKTFFQFSVERTEKQFCEMKIAEGRVDIDVRNGNVFMRRGDEILGTPRQVADYLLAGVLCAGS